ncbi:ABC transporter permease [Streptomyces sp. NPDC001941]|uniref:ABC transporter permease n=1 Tax=Streptomyces sp. NPDC001941 TaxID=3154659 RepID=UPI0033320E85
MSQSVEPMPAGGPCGGSRRHRPGRARWWIRAAGRAWRPAALLAVCCAAWWALAQARLVEPYLLPSPGATVHVLVDRWAYLWRHGWVTTYETLLGFLAAAVVGVLAGVALVSSATAGRTLYPLLLLAQVVPKVAVAPLFVVWLGFGLAPKVLIAVLVAFFPVVVAMVTGLRAVDPEALELAATMGGGRWRTFARIRFPAALPHLFAGLKVAVTLAVTGAVVGEFVGADEGLGYVILQANGNLDTPLLFAGLLVMSLVGVALFAAVEAAERLLVPWHAGRRGTAVVVTTAH